MPDRVSDVFEVIAKRHTVSLAFDDEPPFTTLATQGAQQEVLVLPQPVKLFQKALESDRLVFRHTKLGDEPHTITFDLRELDQVIWKIEESCRWSD